MRTEIEDASTRLADYIRKTPVISFGSGAWRLDAHLVLKLEQQSNQTRFVYNAFTPRWWAAVLLGVLVTGFLGRGLTAEVRAFIDAAPEFH